MRKEQTKEKEHNNYDKKRRKKRINSKNKSNMKAREAEKIILNERTGECVKKRSKV